MSSAPSEEDRRPWTGSEVHAAGLGEWRQIRRELRARFVTGGFGTALDFVARIGEAAEAAGHHPDVDLRFDHVDVRLRSHDAGAITARDIRLARAISALAADAGLEAAPTSVSMVEVALDTLALDRSRAFWAAALGRDGTIESDDLLDPGDHEVAIWFQQAGDNEPDRQRFHLDVHVPADTAQTRVDAALAAGGTLVTRDWEPMFTVLADPEGNKVCVCTWQSRD